MRYVEAREVLEQLEGAEGDPAAALAWVAVRSVAIDADELRAASRRALLLLASGGDPRRELDPGSRAAAGLAEELGSNARRAAFEAALAELRTAADGLPGVSSALDGLVADADLAWRWAACALLAEGVAE